MVSFRPYGLGRALFFREHQIDRGGQGKAVRSIERGLRCSVGGVG